MKAEIISIGSELTCGARLDTNSQWLSRELEGRGWTIQRHTTIADDRSGLIGIFREAAKRSRIVLITGGLGPTLDDITRDTLAEAFDQPLVQDDNALQHIESLFSARNREMPQRNRVQALRPERGQMIPNAHGTAPGILLELSDPDCVFAAMPGVPAEMKAMFHDGVVPRLTSSEVHVQRSLIRTFGLGESDVEQRLGDLTARDRNPEVGITASQAVISLSITARAGSSEECGLLTAEVSDQIHQRLGPVVLGSGDADVHHVLADQLLRLNRRIVLLEGPATGGIMSQWLTENDSYASTIAYSQLFPSADSMLTSDASNAEWETHLMEFGTNLLGSHGADYLLISSPTAINPTAGVNRQEGMVLVRGNQLDRRKDVSMTGNLAIFRQRAARTALNELRLHLAQELDSTANPT